MNTAKYMPHESISPVLIKPEAFPEYPFLTGTGFFVRIDPYEDIFFVTAKHCVLDSEDNPKGELLIYERLDEGCNTKVIFLIISLGKDTQKIILKIYLFVMLIKIQKNKIIY